MKHSAVIFDCDGVLIDSEGISIAVEREHLARIGLEYELEDYQRRFVGLTDDDFYRELGSDFRAVRKGELPLDFAASVKTEVWSRFERDLSAIPGVEEFLDQCDAAKAVASNSPLSSLHRKLEITGLRSRFNPHIYSGEQVDRGKPAPDLFLLAASRLGQSPDRCLIVEDSVNGVRAGLAAGMEVWGFAGGDHADAGLPDRLHQEGAHRIATNFAELLATFQGL